jgi:hypothetical protein
MRYAAGPGRRRRTGSAGCVGGVCVRGSHGLGTSVWPFALYPQQSVIEVSLVTPQVCPPPAPSDFHPPVVWTFNTTTQQQPSKHAQGSMARTCREAR